MRDHALTIAFVLALPALAGFVAVERYAWTSWDAYLQVRTWEICVLGVLVSLSFAAYAVARILELWHKLQFRIARWKKR